MFWVYHPVLSLQRYVKRIYCEKTEILCCTFTTFYFYHLLVFDLPNAPLTIENSLLVAPCIKIIAKNVLVKGRQCTHAGLFICTAHRNLSVCRGKGTVKGKKTPPT